MLILKVFTAMSTRLSTCGALPRLSVIRLGRSGARTLGMATMRPPRRPESVGYGRGEFEERGRGLAVQLIKLEFRSLVKGSIIRNRHDGTAARGEVLGQQVQAHRAARPRANGAEHQHRVAGQVAVTARG